MGIVFIFVFLKKRMFGDASPKVNDAKPATFQLLKVMEKVLILGVIGFIVIQLIRIYFI